MRSREPRPRREHWWATTTASTWAAFVGLAVTSLTAFGSVVVAAGVASAEGIASLVTGLVAVVSSAVAARRTRNHRDE
ncbi:hypothetical protein ACFU5O_01620 [Streptomyces sp. NPDC057445]|uniref:hypothetical protein n=1 Tax=Streptomyces sp. NPDC057445 TaxID=3346136 RepID=UPI0036A6C6CF